MATRTSDRWERAVAAVPKTSTVEIVAAARAILEEDGLAGLTMQALAHRVGIRGPSLYKRFADRNILLAAVEADVFSDLGARLESADSQFGPADSDPPSSDLSSSDRDALWAMAEAYRRFARDAPASYALLFTVPMLDASAAQAVRREALRPVLQRLTSLLGDPEAAFDRARALTAFLHGFSQMEAGGAFRMGGSVEPAFRAGLELLIARPGTSTSG